MRKAIRFLEALVVLSMCALGLMAWAQGTAKPKPKMGGGKMERTTAPTDADMDKAVTLDMLLSKSGAKDWSMKKGATIEGYVIQVEKEKDGDVLLALASKEGETSTTKWVLVEVPSAWQVKDPALSEASLRMLYGKKVKVTGWLNYDTSGDADPRGTLWEINPVTSIS